MFTKTYKNLVNALNLKSIIKSILVHKAINDTLPSDMNELDIDHLFDQAIGIRQALGVLSYTHENHAVEAVLDMIDEYNQQQQELDPDYIDPLIDHFLANYSNVHILEALENSFTITEFLKHVELI